MAPLAEGPVLVIQSFISVEESRSPIIFCVIVSAIALADIEISRCFPPVALAIRLYNVSHCAELGPSGGDLVTVNTTKSWFIALWYGLLKAGNG